MERVASFVAATKGGVKLKSVGFYSLLVYRYFLSHMFILFLSQVKSLTYRKQNLSLNLFLPHKMFNIAVTSTQLMSC